MPQASDDLLHSANNFAVLLNVCVQQRNPVKTAGKKRKKAVVENGTVEPGSGIVVVSDGEVRLGRSTKRGGQTCAIKSGPVRIWVCAVHPNTPPTVIMKLADVLLKLIPYNPLPRYLSEYHPGITPLSDTGPVIATLIAYLVTIFSIQWFMRDKAPLKLTFLFQTHNIFLTGISGLLLVLIGEEILPIWWRNGFFGAICHPRSWTEVL